MLRDLLLNLFCDRAFQIQVEAKQDGSLALFYSMFTTLIDLVELPAKVVQWVKLFYDLVRKNSFPYNSLLFVKPKRLAVVECNHAVGASISWGGAYIQGFGFPPPYPGRIPGGGASPIG